MTFLTHIFKKHTPIASVILAILIFAGLVKIFAIATPFDLGSVIDPNCLPGETNCFVQILPDQTGHSGEFLTTDGSAVAWDTAGGGGSVLPGRCFIQDSANYTQYCYQTSSSSTESDGVFIAPRSGTIKNLYAFAPTAEATGAEITLIIRVNAVDSDLSLVISSTDGTNVVYNTSDTVAINAGDKITLKATTNGTSPYPLGFFEFYVNPTFEFE